MRNRLIVATVVLLVVCAPALMVAQGLVPVLSEQDTHTTALFQAVSVSATNPRLAWISGHAATWAVTTNGGRTWESHVMQGHDSLQFRDVHVAADGRRAWLMAAGTGDKSGIFHTADSGDTWTQVFANKDTAAFYDCMAFWDDFHGFAFSDAVAGHTPIVRTEDGTTWTLSSIPAQDGEGGFAASGGCAQAVRNGTDAWMATGAAANARVRRSTDRGVTWSNAILPLANGSGAGATAIAFRDRRHGVAVGGVIGGNGTGPRVARTTDGGTTWIVVNEPPFTGAIYGAAYARVGDKDVLVAVGPGGAAWSVNDGDAWTMLDARPYWSVGFGKDGGGWIVGPKGRVVRVDWRREPKR